MLHALAFSVLMALGQAPSAPDPGPSSQDLAAYQSARAEAGRDADAHVRLALWCEQHGLKSERLQHLALAVLYDPAHAAARGLMGLVRDSQGHWIRPERLAERIRQDAETAESLAEYNRKRSQMAREGDEESHWKLALWCEEHGLTAEARAHLAAVVRLNPRREAAWKRLGYKRVDGRWMTDEQVAATKAEREAQKAADGRWRPLLAKWKGQLKDDRKRAEAEKGLASVTDPRAVASVWAVFVAGRNADLDRAVQLLGQIDAIASSRALAALAVFGPTDGVRRAASETLRGRDPREFADMLIALIRDPVRYEVRPVDGPGSPGVLFVEGERFNVQRLYRTPAPPDLSGIPYHTIRYDADGLPVLSQFGVYYATISGRITGDKILTELDRLQNIDATTMFRAPALGPIGLRISETLSAPRTQRAASLRQNLAAEIDRVGREEMSDPSEFGFMLQGSGTTELRIPVGQIIAEANKAAFVAQKQLEADVAEIERFNASTAGLNERAAGLLQSVTGLDLGADRKRWNAWYVDQLGYSSRTPSEAPRPTLVQDVPLAYNPRPALAISITYPVSEVVGFQRFSCFGAGTPVHTRDGLRPIEDLKVGDLVLAQDTSTGELSYQPVLVTHHNPPSKTLAVRLGGESIVASVFHRFWLAGKGWAMARDLKPGDVVRTLGGLRTVESVESGSTQPVYNLDVAVGRSFFVGAQGALVHDNSVPDLRAEPFDRPAVLAKAGASDR